MASTQSGMVNPAIFEHLQGKIDQDAKVREELRKKLQNLEKQGQRPTHWGSKLWFMDNL